MMRFNLKRPHLNDSDTARARCARAAATMLATLCACVAVGFAQDAPPPTLTDVGMKLEWARLRGLSERPAAIAEAEDVLDAVVQAGLPAERKLAATLLAAEVHYEQERYAEAEEAFRRAEKSNRRGPFADDAAFAAIEALEARGDDEAAAKQWKKWLKRYPHSPLRSEADLARAWNALRRLSLPEAGQVLGQLSNDSSWMRHDPRVLLANATLAYLEGRFDDALAGMRNDMTGAAATFLRAQCHAAKDARLKAAALYQEVVDRHPDSPLRDHAFLAKANSFFASKAYRSSADEFGRVVESVNDSQVRAEARLRRAASLVLDGDVDQGTLELRAVVDAYSGTNVAARAQFLLGEVLFQQQDFEAAILEFGRVLRDYFEHSLAATAQYRIGRSLDALDRKSEATASYQAVVSGYTLESEAPAAAYLAGVGLLEQGLPLVAAPYFQIVLDRYAQLDESSSVLVFESPEHQELVEASLCLLLLSYHRAGDLGQLSGVPHLTLQQMPPNKSTWRAYALLIDADALASVGRHEETEKTLEMLIRDFPDKRVAILANRLLAWTYAQQGKDELAIQTEERMLSRYADGGNPDFLSSAYLNKAHVLFNQKSYDAAATAYEQFLQRFPDHPERLLALYQAGLTYVRLDRNGDAVDRWDALVKQAPNAAIAERAWVRAGNLYFRAEKYDAAKRCYAGLLQHFAESPAAATAMLRLAQCDYNAGRNAEALTAFSDLALRFPSSPVAREAERGTELALYRLGQEDGGIEVLTRLVDQYPSSNFAADAQFRIAMHHYDKKEFTAAADAFRRVVTQFPGYSAADQAHFLMGDAYEKGESYASAMRAYEQFQMFFPESELRSTSQFRLAMLQFNEGDYMRAAVQFTSVLDSQTNAEMTKASLYNLGMCQHMLGDLDGAKQTLTRYREQYPTDERAAEIAYQLGDIADKSAQYDVALAEFAHAIASKPSLDLRVELRYRTGHCHEQLGETDKALQSYGLAMKSKKRSNTFRLSAVVRVAALNEEQGNYQGALAAYRDLIRNAKDAELVAAAKERATQLEKTVQ
jgi:TolA-binding protein